MKVYSITPQGDFYRKKSRRQDQPDIEVLNFIARRGQASDEQISEFTSLRPGEAAIVLRSLKMRGFVAQG